MDYLILKLQSPSELSLSVLKKLNLHVVNSIFEIIMYQYVVMLTDLKFTCQNIAFFLKM